MPPLKVISVKHNCEMAHRLSLLPGKCQNIHGHSYQITISIAGEPDRRGLLYGIDYGTLKKMFRGWIDTNFDHHLLLNSRDPLLVGAHLEERYPGLATLKDADPTTENFARTIYEWLKRELANAAGEGKQVLCKIEVWETATNNAEWGDWL